MTTAFIDTNILMHYRRVQEIDWPKVIGTQCITIVIAPVVVRELDAHKFDHASAKIRKRVRELLVEFRSMFGNSAAVELRRSVTLQFLVGDADLDFPSHGLRREVNDDWLIASMIEYRSKHEGADVVLVAADFGLELKARAAGFRVFVPPEEARLPEDLDVAERRIRQLEREAATLRNRLPDLRLSLADDAILRLSVPESSEPEISVADRLAEIRHRYPIRVAPDEVSRTVRTQTLGQLLKGGAKVNLEALAGPDEYKRYNRDVGRYLVEYEQYLEALVAYCQRRARRIELTIQLHNDGGAPADDIDIHMHFPNGFELWRLADEPAEPAEPEAPLPLGYIRPMLDPLSHITFPSMLNQSLVSPPSNVSAPDIRKSNSYDVTQHVRNLKHGYSCPLETYVVIFDSPAAVHSFEISYSISAANLPTPASGSVAVVVEVMR